MNIPGYPMEYKDAVHCMDDIKWLIQNMRGW